MTFPRRPAGARARSAEDTEGLLRSLRSRLYAENSLDIRIIAERNAPGLLSSSSRMLEAQRRPTFLASLHGKAETRDRQRRHRKQHEQARGHRRFRDG